MTSGFLNYLMMKRLGASAKRLLQVVPPAR